MSKRAIKSAQPVKTLKMLKFYIASALNDLSALILAVSTASGHAPRQYL
jgi:hypothetical protein